MYDLHIHTSPDIKGRKLTGLQAAKRAKEQGMAGIGLKCHDASTVGQAATAQEAVGILCFGSLVLNASVGGINPVAVKAFAEMGGKLLWFPTMDAENFIHYRLERGIPTEPDRCVCTSDKHGNLLPEVYDVLDVAKGYELVIGTGHLSPVESVKLIDAAAKRSLKNLWVTHVTHPACSLTLKQQLLCTANGAFIEHSYGHIRAGWCSMQDSIAQINSIGSDCVILTTDFGQKEAPYPDEGFLEMINLYTQHGIAYECLQQMTVNNPTILLGLSQTLSHNVNK